MLNFNFNLCIILNMGFYTNDNLIGYLLMLYSRTGNNVTVLNPTLVVTQVILKCFPVASCGFSHKNPFLTLNTSIIRYIHLLNKSRIEPMFNLIFFNAFIGLIFKTLCYPQGLVVVVTKKKILTMQDSTTRLVSVFVKPFIG